MKRAILPACAAALATGDTSLTLQRRIMAPRLCFWISNGTARTAPLRD